MAFEQVGQSLTHFTRRSSARGEAPPGARLVSDGHLWRPIRAAAIALEVEREAQKHLPEWAKMVSFREGRLIIRTPSPTHSQEIFLQAQDLKRKINEGLEGKIVQEIRYRISDTERKEEL